MKRGLLVFIMLLNFGTLLFAAKVPKWVNDPKSVYSEDKYLARTGHGNSDEIARANALAAISGYFKTQVATSTKASSKMTDNNGDVTKQRTIDQETQINTQMDLIAVDYSEIYYDKKSGEYYVCAFINREVAWNSIEPDVIRYLNKYDSLYDKALGEKEDIIRYKYLLKSREAGDELITKLYFGFLINPSKRSEYQSKIDEISNDAIFAVLDEQSIPIYLNVIGDQNGLASSLVNKIFSSFGFIVSTIKSSSQKYELTVNIIPNETWTGEGDSKMVSVFPNVEIKLSNIHTGEEFYTWVRSYSRSSNFTLEKAMQRVLKNNIIPDIEKSLPSDYRSQLMTE